MEEKFKICKLCNNGKCIIIEVGKRLGSSIVASLIYLYILAIHIIPVLENAYDNITLLSCGFALWAVSIVGILLFLGLMWLLVLIWEL
jgi:hypothetical protein